MASALSRSADGTSLILTYTAVVPEPGSLGLAALAATVGGWRLRRRRAIG